MLHGPTPRLCRMGLFCYNRVISVYTVPLMQYWTIYTQSPEASRPFYAYFCHILAFFFISFFARFQVPQVAVV